MQFYKHKKLRIYVWYSRMWSYCCCRASSYWCWYIVTFQPISYRQECLFLTGVNMVQILHCPPWCRPYKHMYMYNGIVYIVHKLHSTSGLPYKTCFTCFFQDCDVLLFTFFSVVYCKLCKTSHKQACQLLAKNSRQILMEQCGFQLLLGFTPPDLRDRCRV